VIANSKLPLFGVGIIFLLVVISFQAAGIFIEKSFPGKCLSPAFFFASSCVFSSEGVAFSVSSQLQENSKKTVNNRIVIFLKYIFFLN